MNRFAWASARTVSEAAAAASTTVADAMTASPDALDRRETSVVKAGGIDLLDLLKENLLAPRKVVSLKEIPGLDAIVEEHAGGLRIGPMVTLASLADHRVVRQRYPALADAVQWLGEPANPQCRDPGRQSAAAAALLVFPGAGISLPEKGRRPLLRDLGRKPIPRDLR